MSLASLRVLQSVERVFVTHLAARLYQSQCDNRTILSGSFSFFFQVQMVVTVQAVELKYRTRFKRQSSRTPGTTIVFSKSLYVFFLTRTVSVNLGCEHATDLSSPD